MNYSNLFDIFKNNLHNYNIIGRLLNPISEVKILFYKLINDSVSDNLEKSINLRKNLFTLITKYEEITNQLLLKIALEEIDVKIISTSINKKIDTNFVKYSFDETQTEFNIFFKKYLSNHRQLRLLTSQNVSFDITKEKAEVYFSYICDCIESFNTRKIKYDDMYNTIGIMIAIAGNLNRKAEQNRWFFFKLCNLAVQILNKNELYQNARDFSEEIYLLSCHENSSIYGCYILLNCYIQQKNTQDALYYFISICSLLEKKPLINDIWINSIILIQRLFRDIHNDNSQDKIFNIIKKHYYHILNNRDKLQINLTYFASKFNNSILNVTDLIIFLDANREMILSEQIESVFSWYLLLKQVNEKESAKYLINYIQFFEKCLPENMIETANQLLGTTQDIITRYNEIYKRLDKTRYHKDMVSEIKNSKVFFLKMIEISLVKSDFSYFINAFRMLSDLSLTKNEQIMHGLIINKFQEDDNEKNYFMNFANRFTSKKESRFEYILLARNKNSIVSLNWDFRTKNIPLLNNEWEYTFMMETMKNLFTIMHFDPQLDDFGNSMECDNLQKQKDILKRFCLQTATNMPIGIITDIDYSCFPINLIRSKNDFLFLKRPVFSALNIECMFSTSKILVDLNQTSLWCPLRSSDITLNQLYDKIEPIITKLKVKTLHTIDFDHTFCGDIMFVIAHGGREINNNGVISATNSFDNIIYKYEHFEKNLIGSKIVILFVCYSGRVTRDIFYEKTNSLIKKIFNNGTKVIIAPKWPLHTCIPPIWLPVFLDSLWSGESALKAFHKASMEVYLKYPNCGAWACLHYYGFPEVYKK